MGEDTHHAERRPRGKTHGYIGGGSGEPRRPFRGRDRHHRDHDRDPGLGDPGARPVGAGPFDAAAKEASTSPLERATREGVCRNIRVLHHFEPPTTPEEIHAAALQYVRKVTGATRGPAKTDTLAFEKAVREVAEATAKVLAKISSKGPPRTREGERERARARWGARKSRIVASG